MEADLESCTESFGRNVDIIKEEQLLKSGIAVQKPTVMTGRIDLNSPRVTSASVPGTPCQKHRHACAVRHLLGTFDVVKSTHWHKDKH
jgi:hypothetical protein